jgi:hypothetical protein
MHTQPPNQQPDTPRLRETASAYAKASADTSARQATPPRPPYQLTRLIEMLERQAEANQAREAANHLAGTAPPPRTVRP